MSDIPSILLNDGHRIPQLGLGIWQVPDADTARVVGTAFDLGYRHVDGAAGYGNEEGLGRAIRASGLPRSELFITTKLRNPDQGFHESLQAVDASLARLGLDYIDLFLIHWPCPRHGRFVDSWKALIEARGAGKVRSIGVSNFRAEDIDRIIDATGVLPAVNQIELHPLLQQAQLRAYGAAHQIVTESWSALAHGGELLVDSGLKAIGRRHGKSVAQVILRWHMQLGLVAFPKSVTPARIAENMAIFDFALDDSDMGYMARLDAGTRLGPDPADFEDMS
ncbi:MAG: aldo/keto reductase [Xanthomonadales bacterium]|nr:aldo/keto reductase [Xanthomonadales bacterium]